MDWFEVFRQSGQIANQGSVKEDPPGVGGNIGYGFTPGATPSW